MRVFCYVVLGAVCSLALPFRSAAAVQLPNLFSDHAVVQRDRPVRIWGSGQAGEMVTLRFHEQTVTAQTDSYGNWEAWLKPEPAGGAKPRVPQQSAFSTVGVSSWRKGRLLTRGRRRCRRSTAGRLAPAVGRTMMHVCAPVLE